MGTAVSAFREKLGESLASIQRYDAKIEEATTPSLEALKAYSQGLRTRRTTGDFDSVPFFRRAIDLDPEFALAYARLGTVYSNLGQADESRKMTTRAYELREKVSEAERLYIEARYYTTVQPDVQKALDTYKVWLGDLSERLHRADQFRAAAQAAGRSRRGDSQARARHEGRARSAAWLDQSRPDLFRGRAVSPMRGARMETAIKLQDSTSARVGLYQIAMLMGDMALAEQQVAAVRGPPRRSGHDRDPHVRARPIAAA